MTELEVIDWFYITDRGWACTVKNPGINPRPLRGQNVALDGYVYNARGIETYCVADDHPALKGPFGILVGPPQ